MGISAPSIRGGLSPAQLSANQYSAQQQGLITPDAAAINAKIQSLPEYQAYQQMLQHPITLQSQGQIPTNLQTAIQKLGVPIPDDLIFDPFIGQFRKKTFSETHSNWSALLYSGAAVGAGLAGGAAVGALTGGGAAAAAGGSSAAAGGVGPLAAGYGAATTSAAVPAALASTGGGAAAAGGLSSWLTTPAASLISTGVQAGLGVYAANKQADTSAQAAQIQAQEFDKALAAQEAENQYQHALAAQNYAASQSAASYQWAKDALATNQYGAYLSRLDPYSRTGQSANNRLSAFMGQPAAAQSPLPPYTPPPDPSVNTILPPWQTPQQVDTALPQTTEQTNNQSAVSSQLQSAANASRGGKPLDYASQGDANGMVLMQAPDGTRKLVPAADVPALFNAGARRVG